MMNSDQPEPCREALEKCKQELGEEIPSLQQSARPDSRLCFHCQSATELER